MKRPRPSGRDIIVIGASAGGTAALFRLIEQFPPDLPAAAFAVMHTGVRADGRLVKVLNQTGTMTARVAEDNDAIENGTVYCAPPDHHLLVKEGRVRVTRGPRENLWRPAIDPLFRSAAVAYGNRVIGIVLTGMLDDGTAGLLAVKRCGGVTIVQDLDESEYSEMPETALANVEVDHCVCLREMGELVERLVREEPPTGPPVPQELELEAEIAETGRTDETVENKLGSPTPHICPECGGPLWEHPSGTFQRFRCRVGHAFGVRSLFSRDGEALESTLWAAVRLFQQRGNISAAMAEREREAGRPRSAEHYEANAAEAKDHARVLRDLVMGGLREVIGMSDESRPPDD
jgi:two-component system chemotaxis response regulator CheB